MQEGGVYYGNSQDKLPEILFITSYPPGDCKAVIYAQHLTKELSQKFGHSFKISICRIESENEQYSYLEEIKYILNTGYAKAFITLAELINSDASILVVAIQYDFDFFKNSEADFIRFLEVLKKPVVIIFHEVLKEPSALLKKKVEKITCLVNSVVVITDSCYDLLIKEYSVSKEKISFIPNVIKPFSSTDKELLKAKYKLSGRKVLTTFGSLCQENSIETTLLALPAIIEKNAGIIFLIVGQTHPLLLQEEGYKYRNLLDTMVRDLQLQNHVQYINYPLSHTELLEYLHLTDIYLATSHNASERVSGIFSYALSCGCPVVATPIAGAVKALQNDAGIIIDFDAPGQLADVVICLLKDVKLRNNINKKGVHNMPSIT